MTTSDGPDEVSKLCGPVCLSDLISLSPCEIFSLALNPLSGGKLMLQVKSKLDKKEGLINQSSVFFQCNQNHFNELFIVNLVVCLFVF